MGTFFLGVGVGIIIVVVGIFVISAIVAKKEKI